MADLSIEVAGLRFKNPIFVSAGEPTNSFEKMKLGIDAGAGAVVAKSYSSEPEMRALTDIAKFCILGPDRRSIQGDIPASYSLYSRAGAVQKSEEDWLHELQMTQRYAAQHGAHVIGSVFGHKDVAETVRLAKRMEDAGLPMLELALSCPQVEETDSKACLLKESQSFYEVVKAVKDVVSIPVFVKLNPQQTDLLSSALSVKRAGGAGATILSRFVGLSIDIETALPHIWGWAGIGGPWMLPISLRWVSKIHLAAPEFPIFGSSGPNNWQDAVQFLMAGASAVEFCSAIIVRGYSVISDTVRGLDHFLEAKGHRRVQDILGTAARAARTYDQLFRLPEYFEKAAVDEEACIQCGKCVEVCWYGAMQQVEDTFRVDQERCKGCRNCQIVCPVEQCIKLSAPVALGSL